MVKTCVRTAGAAYWVRERNSAEPNGPMKIPESPNSTAMASSDGVKAAMTIGIPMPIMEIAVTRGAWSTAIGRQVHTREPMKAPAATAASSSPLPAGAGETNAGHDRQQGAGALGVSPQAHRGLSDRPHESRCCRLRCAPATGDEPDNRRGIVVIAAAPPWLCG